MKYKYIIFDLDWTLISSNNNIKNIIIQYFKEEQPDFYDKVRYTLDFNKISNIQELLIEVYWEKHCKTKHTKIYEFLDLHNNKNDFLDWTIQKILDLKENYKLFLSTWSSTKFANKILKQWWVHNHFEKILWSDVIPKSEKHLDIFKEYSWDKYFFKNSISIWDSPRDELFAKNRWIDFIKIWEEYKSIKDIDII